MLKGYAAIYIKNHFCSLTKSGFETLREAEEYISKPDIGGVPLFRDDWFIVDIESLAARLNS